MAYEAIGRIGGAILQFDFCPYKLYLRAFRVLKKGNMDKIASNISRNGILKFSISRVYRRKSIIYFVYIITRP